MYLMHLLMSAGSQMGGPQWQPNVGSSNLYQALDSNQQSGSQDASGQSTGQPQGPTGTIFLLYCAALCSPAQYGQCYLINFWAVSKGIRYRSMLRSAQLLAVLICSMS